MGALRGERQAHVGQVTKEQRALTSQLLPLMAQRLGLLASEAPRANSTLVNGPDGLRELVYEHVNLGLTVQGQKARYLPVLHEAETLDRPAFCQRMFELQRKAMGDRLDPAEMTGATVGFSSMARWSVARHVPILPPYVSLMVAHAEPPDVPAVLDASYDHHVLTGSDVVALLQQLAVPALD